MKVPLLNVLPALGAALLLGACATIGPPQPPSLELPKPPSDLRAVRKGGQVILTWTVPSVTTDRRTVRSLGVTQICRGLGAELTQCGTPVGQATAQSESAVAPRSSSRPSSLSPPRPAKQKIANSYTDSLTGQMESDNPSLDPSFDPSLFVTYAVEVLNGDGRGAGLSNLARVPLIRTLPPPRDFAARVTGQGVVLTWTGDVSQASSAQAVHYVYRIYRRLEGGAQWTLTGEAPAGGGSLTLTDSNFEWEKTYGYRAETVTVIAQENKPEVKVEGDDSPEIKVFAHDVFPPAVPTGLQAVFSGPGQQAFIDLIWAPVTDVDLDGYNVYRHEEGGAAVKVNAALLKTPAYRDAAVVSGKKYFYAVSAVDVRGNESGRSEEASEAVP